MVNAPPVPVSDPVVWLHQGSPQRAQGVHVALATYYHPEPRGDWSYVLDDSAVVEAPPGQPLLFWERGCYRQKAVVIRLAPDQPTRDGTRDWRNQYVLVREDCHRCPYVVTVWLSVPLDESPDQGMGRVAHVHAVVPGGDFNRMTSEFLHTSDVPNDLRLRAEGHLSRVRAWYEAERARRAAAI